MKNRNSITEVGKSPLLKLQADPKNANKIKKERHKVTKKKR